MDSAIRLDAALVFTAKRKRSMLICLLLLATGGAMAWGERDKPLLRWTSEAPLPLAQLITDGTIAFIILVGLAYLCAVLLCIPRLTVTRQGLTLRTLFCRTNVPWSRLGTFSVVYGQGRQTEKALKAIAPVLVASDAGVAGRPRSLSIPDVFAVPLTTLLRDLATWNSHAGLPTAVSFKAAPERPVGIPGFRWPWLTVLLLSSFILVFILEQRAAVTPGRDLSPSIATLISLGGLSLDLARSGQWYRVLTAPFLHTGLAHIVANGIAFLFAGYALERFVGRAWTFCLFAAGALAGSFASLSWSSPSSVSVGASGAIMAMLVALFMISFRLPPGRAKTFVQVQSARVAIPALIPVVHSASVQVDYGAHFGGAAFGGILGLLLFFTWEEHSPLPTLRATATLFAVVAVLSFARCFYAVADKYPSYLVIARWMPAGEFPKTPQEIAARAEFVLAAYPNDPRSHFFAALARLQKNDRLHAEAQLKTAIAEAQAFPSMFPPSMISAYEVLLARTVLDLGRASEARQIARPACMARGDAIPEPAFKAALDQSGLCAPA